MKKYPLAWWGILGILAVVAISVIYYSATRDSFRTTGDRGYFSREEIIQDAVTSYMKEHDGNLPPTFKGGAAVYPLVNTSDGTIVNTSIFDMCAIIGFHEWMRCIPDGVCEYPPKIDSPDNFWNASHPAYAGLACQNTGGTQHYIWTIDANGNVHSVCDENEDGDWLDIGVTSGLHETVDGYHDEVWP